MTTHDRLDIGPPADETEQRAFRAIADYAFASSPPPTPNIEAIARQGPENYRLARVHGRVAGGLGLLFMGQWFGGRGVPTVGVNAVAIAPEYRSTGIASRLLQCMFEDAHARGVALSVLYPATQVVYRRAGYEQAGVALRYRQPLHALTHAAHGLDVRRAEDGDQETMRALYAERGRRTAGHLDRNEYMWGRVMRAHDTVLNAYMVERDGAPEGYIVYHQEQDGQDRNVVARDLVALTPDAGRALLSFLAAHRSTVDNLVWTGAPADPLFFHMPNQDYTVTWYEQWMLRIVDVRGALEARGYPPALETDLSLEVRDDVLGWNSGRWVLAVSGGRGHARAGGGGDLRLDARGLAPLYSGYLSAEELLSAGYIEGAPETLARASLVFAGPTPWMVDEF